MYDAEYDMHVLMCQGHGGMAAIQTLWLLVHASAACTCVPCVVARRAPEKKIRRGQA